MIISAALLLLSYVSTCVNPAKAWFMTIFGLLFAPLLLCNFLLFVWAILRKSKALVIPFLALLPTVFMAGKFFRFTDNGNVDAEGGVKILTYNVGRFALAQNSRFSSWKECADSAMAFMKSRNADIICIQEFYMDNPEKVRSYLSSKMPGYDIKYFVNINKRGCYGNVTLSRYPALTKEKSISSEARTWPCTRITTSEEPPCACTTVISRAITSPSRAWPHHWKATIGRQ